jgi:hypothetical protein
VGQCSKLTGEFNDVAHFSAGDLLREHVKSGTTEGNMVAEMIKNGQIVPAEVWTTRLRPLRDGWRYSYTHKYLILPFCPGNRWLAERSYGKKWEAKSSHRWIPKE